MIIIGILLSFVVLLFLCWIMFQLATLALPFFFAVTVALQSMHCGAGPIGSVLLGLLVGILVLVAGQLIFTLVPSSIARAATGLVFVLPAALAGFHAVHGLMVIGTSSEAWRTGAGLTGAALVGAAALSRLLPLAANSDVSGRLVASELAATRRSAR